MRKLILLMVFATISCSVFSQKIVKNEKDDFTGKQVKETSYVSISDGFNCRIRVVNETPVFYANFNGGGEIYTMEKGAEFMFKLENDSIVTLYNIETSVSEYFSMGNISHFTLKTNYMLPEEDLNALKTYKITKVRFVTTEGYIERKVSKGNSAKLLKLFNLI
ncbi:MAG: hypothetical protein LBR66_03005 [Candidatus Symbiothrix sp.]|jgi:predicted S18 family serine protease|nr:hypothetical protein [Candidatus Symbiothrix sp.]